MINGLKFEIGDVKGGPSMSSLVGLELTQLSAQETTDMEKMESEYLEEMKTNKDAGSNPKYKKYWQYVVRWRANNK